MKTAIILTAAFVIALTTKIIWGRNLSRIHILRDTNLSLKGLVGALGISVLIATGITISTMGGQLDGLASESDGVVYAQSNVTAVEPETSSEYADGVYSGTANGFKGPITVAVKIAGGIISQVEVTDQQDDRKWFERAYAGVVQEILKAQNADVDTVSGATYSSQGIIAGAAEALNKARAAVK